MLPLADTQDHAPIDDLATFVGLHPRLFVLTGAGCSTDSGIPDYRDSDGEWKHQRPVDYRDFVRSENVRKRYWARSTVGWPRFARARPNDAHRALARLEAAGHVHHLATQNVDGLHQRAGHHAVTDLHGRLDTVACQDCATQVSRDAFQRELEACNPGLATITADIAPDGDVALEGIDFGRFRIPECGHCGGMMKPAVVFFGENVPRPRVAQTLARLAESDAVLVVGSSLMVYSGYRICRAASEAGKPLAAVNLGRTRADDELSLKLAASCGRLLPALARRLGA
jgi:NAD-dependent SIR2 family protein deacetylase